jgi:hypothetical protein
MNKLHNIVFDFENRAAQSRDVQEYPMAFGKFSVFSSYRKRSFEFTLPHRELRAAHPPQNFSYLFAFCLCELLIDTLQDAAVTGNFCEPL